MEFATARASMLGSGVVEMESVIDVFFGQSRLDAYVCPVIDRGPSFVGVCTNNRGNQCDEYDLRHYMLTLFPYRWLSFSEQSVSTTSTDPLT